MEDATKGFGIHYMKCVINPIITRMLSTLSQLRKSKSLLDTRCEYYKIPLLRMKYDNYNYKNLSIGVIFSTEPYKFNENFILYDDRILCLKFNIGYNLNDIQYNALIDRIMDQIIDNSLYPSFNGFSIEANHLGQTKPIMKQDGEVYINTQFELPAIIISWSITNNTSNYFKRLFGINNQLLIELESKTYKLLFNQYMKSELRKNIIRELNNALDNHEDVYRFKADTLEHRLMMIFFDNDYYFKNCKIQLCTNKPFVDWYMITLG